MARDIVFLHGWGQHSGAWAQLASQLNPDDRLHFFDLPGHGADSNTTDTWSLDTLVDNYAGRSPARCHVVGWSLGGQLALRWAQKYPAQVSSLALIATTPCFGERADWSHGTPTAIQQAFAEQIAADPAQGLLHFADLIATGEADVRSTRRALRQLLGAAATPHTAALLAGLQLLAETDLRASLVSAPPPQPIVLIHGTHDTITPFATSPWLAQILPQARLCALDNCGHAPMLSHSAAVAVALQNFLDE